MSVSTIFEALFEDRATTEGVTVGVAPSYLIDQSVPDQNRWVWSYHIRIENHREDAVQLLTRHWKITDGRGAINHVDGDGVVGEQPILQPGGSHDYVSACPLTTPFGTMEGHYRFICADGSTFLVEIPRFRLVAPATAQ